MRCPIWTSLFNLSWLAPGRMPFGWLFLSFFPPCPSRAGRSKCCFVSRVPPPSNLFFQMLGLKMRKQGRKAGIQGCCVQLCRLHSTRPAAEGSAVKPGAHSTCPLGGSGRPCPLKGGVGQRSSPSEHCSHQPCSFLLLLLLVFSLLSLQQKTYMKSLVICFSPHGKVSSCSRNSLTGNETQEKLDA